MNFRLAERLGCQTSPEPIWTGWKTPKQPTSPPNWLRGSESHHNNSLSLKYTWTSYDESSTAVPTSPKLAERWQISPKHTERHQNTHISLIHTEPETLKKPKHKLHSLSLSLSHTHTHLTLSLSLSLSLVLVPLMNASDDYELQAGWKAGVSNQPWTHLNWLKDTETAYQSSKLAERQWEPPQQQPESQIHMNQLWWILHSSPHITKTGWKVTNQPETHWKTPKHTHLAHTHRTRNTQETKTQTSLSLSLSHTHTHTHLTLSLSLLLSVLWLDF